MIKYLKLAKAITFVMAFGFLKGQEFIGHTITPIPETNPVIDFDENQFIQTIMNEYNQSEKNKKFLQNYAFYCMENRLESLSSSTEFNEWEEAEMYLQKIISQMHHPEWVTKKLRVKFVRDPAANASAYEDGTIYVNVGFLTLANTEAELAALLSHEIGHVFLHHNYERYKAYNAFVQEMSIGNIVGGVSGILIRKLARGYYSGHSIKSEEAADNYSALALKNSEYAYTGIIRLFESLKLKSDLYDSRVKFISDKKYFKTHPPGEKRIENARKLLLDTLPKRGFIVDSLYFYQIKQQCIDESIYLLFRSMQYEDCIELAFKQHLEKPEDKFYLTFLQQSLIRLLTERPELSNKRFITYRYVIDGKQKLHIKPLIAYSQFYKNKPAEFVYNLCVFYQLHKIYGLTDSAISLLPNKKLTSNDTLEFINNEDALSYFTKTSNSLGCEICSYNTLPDTVALHKTAKSTTYAEKYLYSLAPTLNSYLNQKQSSKKRLFVITNYSTSYYTLFNTPQIGENKIGLLYSYVKENKDLSDTIIIPPDLSFDHREIIPEYFEKIQNNLPDPGETTTSKFKVVNKKYYNCQALFPELAQLMAKYDLEKINFLSVKKVQQSSGGGPMGGITTAMMQLYNYIIHCYSLDLKNNTICKYSKNIGDATDRMIFNSAMEAFEEINQSIVKPK